MSGSAVLGGRKRPPPLAKLRRLAARTHRWDEVRERADSRRLTISQVLAWADAYHARNGAWPRAKSGLVIQTDPPGARRARAAQSAGVSDPTRVAARRASVSDPTRLRTHPGRVGYGVPLSELTWQHIAWAMQEGYRGFQPGGSLARFLKKHRGVQPGWRDSRHLPPFSIRQILAWADGYHAKTGRWPHQGGHDRTLVPPYERWISIDHALVRGKRGLPGGSSLAGLLAERRGVYSVQHTPPLTRARILAWADAHHRRTGSWPHTGPNAGRVFEDRRESWNAINACLRYALRGLPGGQTLAGLLHQHRGVANNFTARRFSVPEILKWARQHQRRTGKWPQASDGPVHGVPHETWMKVHQALTAGQRGLPGGDTLAKLLHRTYGVPIAGAPPKLEPRQMLAWADAHYVRTGQWPRINSGRIPESATDTWYRVDVALRMGMRGLPGGSTLHRFLALHKRGNLSWAARQKLEDRPTAALARQVRWLSRRPLDIDEILLWADAYHRRTGLWPRQKSGLVPEVQGLTWSSVDQSLREGHRGLPGGTSLADLLQRERGVPLYKGRRQHGPDGRFARGPRLP